jgi:hypothetical protein
MEAADYMGFAVTAAVVAAIVAPLWLLLSREKTRREAEAAAVSAAVLARLVERFGDDDARRIWQKEIWQGETSEMVRESLGPPVEVDEKVLKTKTKHTWKYEPQGGNRFALRVFLEDGVVVGWER